MLTWFRESAPIRRKMSIVVVLQTLWILGAAGAALLAAAGIISFEAGAATASAILAVAIVSGTLMATAISEPYVTTVNRMEALAQGDLDTPIEFTTYTDCVGRMTQAMQSFREAAIARQAAEAEAVTHRTTAEQLRQAQDVARATLAREQAQVVSALAGGLSGLASGNLLDRMEVPFATEYEALRTNFNEAVAKLQETMRLVAASGSAIRSGATEVAKAADDLSRRTEQQAANLEQTAAALDEITATVRRTADGSQQARTTVTAAKREAEGSGVVMQNAIHAMGEIETSARAIGAIIGTIDEIAFQTNLLALNAGVEAARAGDAGRGFAVVASEVRALAQRSADAAKEIKALISTSTRQVASGVELVAQTGTALTCIVAQITEIDGVVTEIAASTREQATGLAEVNTAINQMDQITQQNAAMVEESNAASHGLTTKADELARHLDAFQIGALPEERQPRMAAPRRTASPLKLVASQGTARSGPRPASPSAPRPAVLAKTDNWAEF